MAFEKSKDMHAQYCEDLRNRFEQMSDAAIERELDDNPYLAELLSYIGFKRAGVFEGIYEEGRDEQRP